MTYYMNQVHFCSLSIIDHGTCIQAWDKTIKSFNPDQPDNQLPWNHFKNYRVLWKMNIWDSKIMSSRLCQDWLHL